MNFIVFYVRDYKFKFHKYSLFIILNNENLVYN